MIGQKFGKLTIIERSRKPNGAAAWLCNCDCGGTTLATTSGLNKGDNKSCGCNKHCGRTLKDMTGHVYNSLTVLSRYGTDDKNGNTTWLCQCVCGNTRVAQRGNLLLGKVTSCGCKIDRVKFTLEELLYNGAKLNKKRGNRAIPFMLTQEQFLSLVNKDCHYCGIEPLQKYKTLRGGEEVILLYNGIDRINSNLGYEINNCVPCCGTCNSMKMALPYEDFIQKIHRIANKHPIFTPVLT